MNKKWSADDIYNLRVPSCDYESLGTAFGVCRHKLLNTTTGKYKLMMIGNSWAPNHGTIVFEECGYKAKSLVQVAVSACEALYNTTDYRCNHSVEMFREKVKNEQPDYLFIFSRFINIGDPMTVSKIEDDPIYREMMFNAEQLSKSVKYKIFIMHQIPRANLTMLSEIVDQVKGNKDLVAFDKSLIVRDAEIARLRYEKLVSGCPKCELFDYKPQFFNETTGTWRFYDERNHGLTYLTQGLHLRGYLDRFAEHILSRDYIETTATVILLKMSNGKRQDLQGIRGVAIISVILFHFLPSIFPNGYIGVDEFFVLSGYLMCQLLINQKKKKKKKNKESSDIFIFYIRRLKRILPLYFLILFLSIISIFTLFPFESIHLNVISAKNAALFISNRPKTEDEDYFQMVCCTRNASRHGKGANNLESCCEALKVYNRIENQFRTQKKIKIEKSANSPKMRQITKNAPTGKIILF
uniref:Acyl_transf_3 domain-containing protein n=2 Tax=Caenorhabditis tropicalis TaxID=1561998 RepID=A0A1I7UI16_9PELO